MNYNFPPGQGRYFVLPELTKQKSGPGKRPLVVFINPLFNQSLIEFFFHFNQHIDRHILKVVFRLPAPFFPGTRIVHTVRPAIGNSLFYPQASFWAAFSHDTLHL